MKPLLRALVVSVLCAGFVGVAFARAQEPATQPATVTLRADRIEVRSHNGVQSITGDATPVEIRAGSIEDNGAQRVEMIGPGQLVYQALSAGQATQAAHLGVHVAAPGDVLRSQLKLSEGTGLVVESVEDNGPAKGALRPHDVMTKLDDQVLVNAEQLTTLIRLHKPGDTVRVSVIREAAPQTVTVKLSEADAPPLTSIKLIGNAAVRYNDGAGGGDVLQAPLILIGDRLLKDASVDLSPATQPTTQPATQSFAQPTTQPVGQNRFNVNVAEVQWANDLKPVLVALGAPEQHWANVAEFAFDRSQAVRTAYLGVSVGAPDEVLRSQLKLPDGTGLVIQWVDEQGPSKESLRPHDVMTKLDDQLLVNAEQFTTLVRLHKAGDAVRVTVVREAAPQTVTVKLSEKDAPPLRTSIDLGTDLVIEKQANRVPVLTDVPVLGNLFVNKAPATQPSTQPAGTPSATPAPPTTQPSGTAGRAMVPVLEKNAIDGWVLSRLDAVTLSPPAENDRAAILRRLSLDVTGLPPTEHDVEQFVNDKSPDAYEKVVHRLLGNVPATVVLDRVARQEGLFPTGYAQALGAVTHLSPSRSVSMGDGEFRLTLKPGGEAELTITDRKTGELKFKGPVQTVEQWRALPESARIEIDTWRQSLDGWRDHLNRPAAATTRPAAPR